MRRPHPVSLAVAALLLAGCSTDSAATGASQAAPATKKKEEAAVHSCNICGKDSPFQAVAGRPDAQCPKCQSRERHRLLMHYLQHQTALPRDKLDVLHFSPMRGERRALKKWKNLNYKSADYVAGEDLQLDLTALTQPDASWDVLIAYHILEHIPDDRKAIGEMFRVLRPGGQVILQVPIDIGQVEMYEDPTITDPKAREKAFGQWDHVRKYSEKGLRERLEAAGFTVEIVDYLAKLDPAEVEKFSMRSKSKVRGDERIWLANKPLTPPEPRTEPAPAEPTKTPEPAAPEPDKKTKKPAKHAPPIGPT